MNLQEWARRERLTPAILARRLGLNVSTTSEIFHGRRLPRAQTVLKLHELSGGAITCIDVALYIRNRRNALNRPKAPLGETQ
jgi:transcriptional regulator with XRE-family HTH domain